MRRNIFILIWCTLISAFGFCPLSFAMDSDLEKDLTFMTHKATCQGLFPELSEKLTQWVKIKPFISMELMNRLLEKQNYTDIANCLKKAQEHDKIFPRLVALTNDLMGSLASLQEQHPEIEDKKMKQLLGIEDQYNSIIDNLPTLLAFIATSSGCDLSDLNLDS